MIWALFSVSGSHVAKGMRASIHTLSLLWGIGMLYVRESVQKEGGMEGLRKRRRDSVGVVKKCVGGKLKGRNGEKEGTKREFKAHSSG